MAHVCVRHLHELSEDLCESCGHDYCGDCLVYPKGRSNPPLCVPCALEAGGVRSVARTVPKLSKREIRQKLRERRREDRLAGREGEPEPVDAALSEDWSMRDDPPPPGILLGRDDFDRVFDEAAEAAAAPPVDEPVEVDEPAEALPNLHDLGLADLPTSDLPPPPAPPPPPPPARVIEEPEEVVPPEPGAEPPTGEAEEPQTVDVLEGGTEPMEEPVPSAEEVPPPMVEAEPSSELPDAAAPLLEEPAASGPTLDELFADGGGFRLPDAEVEAGATAQGAEAPTLEGVLSDDASRGAADADPETASAATADPATEEPGAGTSADDQPADPSEPTRARKLSLAARFRRNRLEEAYEYDEGHEMMAWIDQVYAGRDDAHDDQGADGDVDAGERGADPPTGRIEGDRAS